MVWHKFTELLPRVDFASSDGYFSVDVLIRCDTYVIAGYIDYDANVFYSYVVTPRGDARVNSEVCSLDNLNDWEWSYTDVGANATDQKMHNGVPIDN